MNEAALEIIKKMHTSKAKTMTLTNEQFKLVADLVDDLQTNRESVPVSQTSVPPLIVPKRVGLRGAACPRCGAAIPQGACACECGAIVNWKEY